MRLPYHRTVIAVCLLGVLICLALIVSGCASSRAGKALNVGVGLAAGLDLHSTRQVIDRGLGYEANPFLGQSAWRQGLLKAIGTTAVVGLSGVVERQHPVVAHLLRSVAIVAWSVAARHNYGIARQ